MSEILGNDELINNEEKYRNIISSMSQGFALHEILTNNEGVPVDYKYLEINDSFEKILGMKRVDVIDKTVKEILPGTENYWIENYGNVALTGKPMEFEHYSQELNKYFKINAYSPVIGQFAVIATDITEQKNNEKILIEKTEEAEKLNLFMVGRETKMVELKQEIEDLKAKLEIALKTDK